MFKVLNADLRKLIYHAGLRECLVAVTIYLMGYTIVMKAISCFMDLTISADDIFNCYGSMTVLLVSICTLITTVSDYADGCIRNKLISGAGRPAVFLSAVISGMIQALVLSVTAFVESLILSLIFTRGGLVSMTAAYLADEWIVIIFAGMAIAAFSTMLIMLLGGNRSAYTAGIAVAIGMNIFGREVVDKLYPAGGVCTLTGTRLMIYSFFDSYVPYAYPAFPLHHGMGTYFAGILGLTALSVLAGLVLFNRKEIQ